MPANFGAILALVVFLVSVIMAFITNGAGNPIWLMLCAIFIAIFFAAKWPW